MRSAPVSPRLVPKFLTQMLMIPALIMLTAIPAGAEESLTPDSVKSMNATFAVIDSSKSSSVAQEIAGGVAGGVLGLFLGGMIGSLITSKDSQDGTEPNFSGLAGFMCGGAIGLSAGVILGCKSAKWDHRKQAAAQKRIQKQPISDHKAATGKKRTRFSVGGALCGLAVGDGINITARDSRIAPASIVICPLVGAIVGRYIWPE